jgi:hypothetical protein
MCPACLTTAALIAGSVTSTGGLAAVVIKKFGIKKFGVKKFGVKNTEGKNAADHNPATTPSQEDHHV